MNVMVTFDKERLASMALMTIELVDQGPASTDYLNASRTYLSSSFWPGIAPFPLSKPIILKEFDRCAKHSIRWQQSVEMLCAMQRRPNEPVHQQR
jgi:hypothetical protein